jgi:RNA polymerase sigma factor (TIGR02999 family)
MSDVASQAGTPGAGDLTRLLHASREGDREASELLMRHVYDDLRMRAHRQLAGGLGGDTLNTTALVNEAYLRLLGTGPCEYQDRHHFFGVAARVMRGVVVDYARRRGAQKRGSGQAHNLLDDNEIAVDGHAAEIVGLDAALVELERMNQRLGRVVELRFFAGLSVEQTAEALGVTTRTVKRDWRTARAFLHRAIGSANGGERADG